MSWLILLYAPSIALLLVRPGGTSSKRLLTNVLLLMFPIVGPVLALIVCRTRGGKIELAPEEEAPTTRLTADDVRRLGELPSSLERLLSNDPAERLAALVHLSANGDSSAVAVLRWTIDHGSSEAVLDAALTLEELNLREEARLDAARQRLTEQPTFEHALAAGDAATTGLFNGIVDPALAPSLADEARTCFELALQLQPSGHAEVEERLARLELMAVRPQVALERLSRLGTVGDAEVAVRLEALRDEAAFQTRNFAMLSYRPYAPALDAARKATRHLGKILNAGRLSWTGTRGVALTSFARRRFVAVRRGLRSRRRSATLRRQPTAA